MVVVGLPEQDYYQSSHTLHLEAVAEEGSDKNRIEEAAA